jgi:hypothetical protein
MIEETEPRERTRVLNLEIAGGTLRRYSWLKKKNGK